MQKKFKENKVHWKLKSNNLKICGQRKNKPAKYRLATFIFMNRRWNQTLKGGK
ncbi:hypothetical protein [Spiroplasma sp. DGKH1]|uniref:hypothetical protein n=1 Tax=Spiroplasma sp. DGKH1 TaxID=3050074 RepID=UPI0034C64F93